MVAFGKAHELSFFHLVYYDAMITLRPFARMLKCGVGDFCHRSHDVGGFCLFVDIRFFFYLLETYCTNIFI
jgi:hypothetical protein